MYAGLLLNLAKVMGRLHPRNYRNEFDRDLDEILNAAEKIRFRWPHGQNDFQTAKNYIKDNFLESFQTWNRLSRNRKDYSVRSGDRIMLRKGPNYYGRRSDDWLSCWGSGSVCIGRSCPGSFGRTQGCRGEQFWIYAIGKDDGTYVQNCDKVGIQYSLNDGRGYWLSHHYGNRELGLRNEVWTLTCPGQHFTADEIYYCSSEVWQIYDKTKKCGETLGEQDLVDLKAVSRDLLLNLSRKVKIAPRYSSTSSEQFAQLGFGNSHPFYIFTNLFNEN